jgi:hypothetical protein
MPSKHIVDRDHPTHGNYYLETNKPLLPDPYNLVEYFYEIERKVVNASNEIPWENKDFKIFFRGQCVDTSMDISDDCIKDAYDGRNSRLGIVLEGLKYPEFVDVRYSETRSNR